MNVPANAVFRCDDFIFTDEGEVGGELMVGVCGLDGVLIERLPLMEARDRYAAQFDRLAAEVVKGKLS